MIALYSNIQYSSMLTGRQIESLHCRSNAYEIGFLIWRADGGDSPAVTDAAPQCLYIRHKVGEENVLK